MHIINRTVNVEGGHLACLIFLPGNPTDQAKGEKYNSSEISGDSMDLHATIASAASYRQQETWQSVPHTAMKAIVIACHGFRGGKENGGRINSLGYKLNKIGLGLIAFDFRGSGESSGNFSQMTISSQAADLKQIINWCEHTYKVPVIVLGRSLGGSTVLAAMGSGSCAAASVLWSTPVNVKGTFTSILGDAAQQLSAGKTVSIQDEYSSYELSPLFWQDLLQHDFIKDIRIASEVPMLVIHGEADQVVNPANALQIKEQAPKAQIIMVPQADHKFINGWELREDFTVAWLNHLIS